MCVVEHCESLCEAFEVLDVSDYTIGAFSQRKLNKAATLANIRLHYYVDITKDEKAFDKLSFLLLDATSRFWELTQSEQKTILYHNGDIWDRCFVFV